METPAFQDLYPDQWAHCYGCGRLNEHGLQIKSHWDGDETVCIYTPRPYHIAIPGYVYGGLIASLIDSPRSRSIACACSFFTSSILERIIVSAMGITSTFVATL